MPSASNTTGSVTRTPKPSRVTTVTLTMSITAVRDHVPVKARKRGAIEAMTTIAAAVTKPIVRPFSSEVAAKSPGRAPATTRNVGV
ncbi:Uncharacterised protein [Collinsella intestinalis]|nr:Uncharacterised protein [Collinsella intestinalis]